MSSTGSTTSGASWNSSSLNVSSSSYSQFNYNNDDTFHGSMKVIGLTMATLMLLVSLRFLLNFIIDVCLLGHDVPPPCSYCCRTNRQRQRQREEEQERNNNNNNYLDQQRIRQRRYNNNNSSSNSINRFNALSLEKRKLILEHALPPQPFEQTMHQDVKATIPENTKDDNNGHDCDLNDNEDEKNYHHNSNDNICSICLHSFQAATDNTAEVDHNSEKNETVVETAKEEEDGWVVNTSRVCGANHLFHPHCLAEWVVENGNNDCPYCRTTLITDNDIQHVLLALHSQPQQQQQKQLSNPSTSTSSSSSTTTIVNASQDENVDNSNNNNNSNNNDSNNNDEEEGECREDDEHPV